MSEDETLVGSRALVVLFADIAGSTRLYEECGDAAAREATATCIAVMGEVVERFDGRVVKTIGDEIMAVFDDPAKGAMAGTDLQGVIREAGEAGRFPTGPLRIKVGLHYGPGVEERGDVLGETRNVAQAIIKQAKADQVLTSSETLEALPPMLRANTRRLEGADVGDIQVHEFIWEVSGLTQVANVNPVRREARHAVLVLSYGDTTVRCDGERPALTLGRVAGNDLVVPSDLTSRQHLEVEFRNGRFRITDNSANGTVVADDEAGTTTLRREHAVLRSSGRLCLGGTPEDNPRGVVAYRCE